MTPIERIQKAKVAIMRHPQFCAFSGVLAFGQHAIDDTFPTAYTNGKDVKYNSKFVLSLSEPELRLLVLHEALHISFRHVRVWKHLWKQDARMANVAADHFVNLSLVDTDSGGGFLAMPSMGVQPEPRYRGWSVQMIFDDLMQQGQGQGQGQGSDNPGDGFDQHDWEAGEALSEQEAEEQARAIDQALRQGEMLARKRGQGTGASSMLLDTLLAPKVDWREQLRDFITQVSQGRDEATWARPNRRYISDDVYMPSMQSVSMDDLVVAIDTSGSCFTGSVIKRFVSELATIIEQVKPSKVRVLYWDTDVCAEQVFDDGQFVLASVKPSGGGGTDGACVSRYLTAKRIQPEAVVVFTDGEVGSWGTQVAPTLWAITERSIRAPWGTTVHVEV